MSIIRCELCESQVDSDLVNMVEYGDESVCEECCEEEFQEQVAYWKPLYEGEKRAGFLPEKHYNN
jgi:ribosome-binding protein aMBF1 (putative translation factor)